MKHAGSALAVLSLLLAAAVLLAGLERARGSAALAEAQVAESRGELPLAIAAARVAAEARVPYTDHADNALALLERVADRARASRDPATASLALRVARQAAQATGQGAREASLRQRLREDEAALEKAPVQLGGETAQRPAEPRATGAGRGSIGALAQLGMVLGVALLALALLFALRGPAARLRLCFALSACGTLVLALARSLA